MNKILTDAEITLIIRECARGSAINRDGSTSHRIARAIEQAILNKLSEQKPVAEVVWYDPVLSATTDKAGKIIDASMSFIDTADLGTKLYAVPPQPAPSVPEGYQLVPIEPTDAMREAWDGESSLMGTWNAMLAAARSDRELQHEHTMKQFQEVCNGRNCYSSKARPAPSVPEGYQLVPIEPTKAMMWALYGHWVGHLTQLDYGYYKAMLAAARSE